MSELQSTTTSPTAAAAVPGDAVPGAAVVADSGRMPVRTAQDLLARLIPEIEKLAWRFFTVARELEAPLEAEGFDDQEPGPEHLRWHTALAALAVYGEMLEMVAAVRRAAENTEADLREEWQSRETLAQRAASRGERIAGTGSAQIAALEARLVAAGSHLETYSREWAAIGKALGRITGELAKGTASAPAVGEPSPLAGAHE